MRRVPAALVVALALVLAGGCAKHSAPVGHEVQLTADQSKFEAVWQASQDVLKRYYFSIDTTDRRSGVILTEPMTGECFGEFWRKDAATRSDLEESTIQTIYRQARVVVTPAESGDGFQADVEVVCRRSDRPARQVSSTADAIGLFAASRGRDVGEAPIQPEGETPAYQVDLGSDEGLAARIAADIQAAAPGFLARLGQQP
jgi:hypothetical protein